MTATLELIAGPSRLVIAPAVGGALVRHRWRDIDILRPAPDEAVRDGRVRLMACYPLVPYSNRIAHAKLKTADREYSLRPNFPPEPHAIHGVGWQRAWQVLSSHKDEAVLALDHAPDPDWPFAFRAEQSFKLEPDALSLTLSLTNRDSRAMPAGLGFHPFFPIRPGLHLQTRWSGMWEMGEDKLPTRHVATPTESDFSVPRPVDRWKIDNVFTGWERVARLEHDGHTVVLTANEVLSRVVCFAPRDGRDFVAIEPVSHVINAFNMDMDGVKDTGALTLPPGATLTGSLRIAMIGRGHR
ncbi:MAG: aldose 1-epimerase [Betaproteobacteria bacterium]|nr:aldose 1-epimerase [Betaproteobacteria bacterium]